MSEQRVIGGDAEDCRWPGPPPFLPGDRVRQVKCCHRILGLLPEQGYVVESVSLGRLYAGWYVRVMGVDCDFSASAFEKHDPQHREDVAEYDRLRQDLAAEKSARQRCGNCEVYNPETRTCATPPVDAGNRRLRDPGEGMCCSNWRPKPTPSPGAGAGDCPHHRGENECLVWGTSCPIARAELRPQCATFSVTTEREWLERREALAGAEQGTPAEASGGAEVYREQEPQEPGPASAPDPDHDQEAFCLREELAAATKLNAKWMDEATIAKIAQEAAEARVAELESRLAEVKWARERWG